MKITLYYEDKNPPTILDVPDEECTVMVETDYQNRLAAADDKSAVRRRTVQEIMDEDFNKPTFNNNHAETRRHVSLAALDPEGDSVAGAMDVDTDLFRKDYAELYRAIDKLRPQQREIIRRVFWDEIRKSDIAREDGVDRAAVAGRLNRIIDRLKKFLPDQEIFF